MNKIIYYTKEIKTQLTNAVRWLTQEQITTQWDLIHPTNQQILRVKYSGSHPWEDDIKGLFYSQGYSIKDVINSSLEAYDIGIYQQPPLAMRSICEERIFQPLVDMKILLPSSFSNYSEQFASKLIRRKINHLRKKNWSIEASNTPQALDIFYSQMTDYAQIRFGGAAHIPSKLTFAQKLSKAKIITIKNNDNVILGSAFLLMGRPGSWRFLRSGMSSHIFDNPKDLSLVTTAIYLWIIEAAINSGEEVVSLGLTQALRTNGGYFYKSLWGSEAHPCPEVPWFSIELASTLGSIFLGNIPLIYRAA